MQDISDLDAFVRHADSLGADFSKFDGLRYSCSTPVDQDLDPFSPEYVAQQVAVYEEVSGRRFNQSSGELHNIGVDYLFDTPNPLGIANPAHVSEHVRCISTMLSLCALPEGSRVLDMGAGHGVASEVLAFCGCHVDAVDIDPELSRLARIRAERRGLPITRKLMNFDDLSGLMGPYNAAFFFQSLHHSLTPWTLIERIKEVLAPGGLIMFAGEPVQQEWWRNWGVRLDAESLYVARAHGWFESGFSAAFVRAMFSRAGMEFAFLTGGHMGGVIGMACNGPIQHKLEWAHKLGHQVIP